MDSFLCGMALITNFTRLGMHADRIMEHYPLLFPATTFRNACFPGVHSAGKDNFFPFRQGC